MMKISMQDRNRTILLDQRVIASSTASTSSGTPT